jgi:GDP-L-fucose synthase
MSSSKKKILICGATGFVGRNLVEYYAAKSEYDVHATHFQRAPYNIKNVTFHRADLRDPAQLPSLLKGVDILIQAAATTSGSKDIVNTPALHVTDNAVMNSYIMREAVTQKIAQVIFFSCTVMYPNSDTPLKENDFDDQNVYAKYFGVGWTKVYIEKVCEFFSRVGTTKFTVIRHSNIYGPYDKYDLEKSHVFGATVTKVMTADKKITVWGDGSETRDLLYVDDLTHFVNLAVEKQQTAFELVNVGLGQNISIKQLVEKIVKSSGKNIDIEFDTTKPTIPTKVILNIDKAHQVFNWKPQTSLDEGIKKTIGWYKENVK